MTEKMKEIIDKLNAAAESYYMKDEEIMSNFEYDALYDELLHLESESGIVLPDSPTKRVGFEVVSKLVKESHEIPALSLNKTKDRDALKNWLKNEEGVLSWKLDGLTIVVTYDNGKLVKAVTRGNGVIGEVITHNAKYFVGLPSSISYTGHLVVRGEAHMLYDVFEKINANISNPDDKYKNPRNLASGIVRSLDSKKVKMNQINFKLFEIVIGPEESLLKYNESLEWGRLQGFDVVNYKVVDSSNILDTIESFEKQVSHENTPTDGLVLQLNDLKFAKSLGATGKYPKYAMAFKWQDETATTVLKDVFWSASRTGLINPVAVFEPVELEGTTVSRASLHNLNYIEDMKLGIGDTITVYKANMIIPQLAENITKKGGLEYPKVCPLCMGATEVVFNKFGSTKVLMCKNPNCITKHIGDIAHFVSRDGMNIEGLAESTIEKFVGEGYIKEFADIYLNIKNYKDEICLMNGFGKKAFDNLIASIEKSKNVNLNNFIYALCIPNIGKDNAKILAKECISIDGFISKIIEGFDFSEIDGIGDIMNKSIYDWYEINDEKLMDILSCITVNECIVNTDDTLSGKTFVITGSLNTYNNRDELKTLIESKGGKVSSSVSAKTSYLINNDINSNSGKNKTAKSLNIPIITEEDFNNML